MKHLITKIFVAFVVVTMIASCGNKGLKQASLIPKEASMVLVFNQKMMTEKLKSGNFEMDSIINKLMTSIDSARGKKLATDWKNAGVNTEDNIIVFMAQGNAKNSKTNSVNAIVTLTDAAKFEAFLKSQDELKTVEIVKGKSYSSIKLEKEVIISWTKDFAMITAAYKNPAATLGSFGKANEMPETIDMAALTAKTVENLYSLKEEEKITSVKYFNEMFNKKADAYMFTSMASLNDAMSMMPFQLPKLEELLQDNYTVSYLNFENGKIVMDGTSYFNDKINNIAKQYGNGSVKMSMLENFPAKNTNAAMLISIKPEMIGGILKELQLETLIDAGLSSQQMKFGLQDIYKCMKGDIAVAVGDFEIGKDSINSGSKPTMKVLFNAEVGDKVSLAKILNQAVEMQALVNNNGVYTISPTMAANAPMYLRIDDKNIVIASNENTYAQYTAKTTKATFNKEFANNLSGKYMAMYFDINSFLSAFNNKVGNNQEAKKIMDKALATFDNMSGTCSNFKDGKVEGNFIVKMKNEKENSLVSIANFFKIVAEEMTTMSKEGKLKPTFDDEVIDSTTVTPIESHKL